MTMHVPNLSRFDPPLFAVGATFALCAIVFYFQIVTKLRGAGITPPVFISLRRLVAIFGVYSEMAPEKGWPRWLVKGFWLTSTLALVIGIVVGFKLK
jgi:hypothetical protein